MFLKYSCYFANSYLRQLHTTAMRKASPHEIVEKRKQIKTALNYFTALTVAALGAAYAAVPLYRVFCQATSYGGTTKKHNIEEIDKLKLIKSRPLKITFNADISSNIAWNFKPQQKEVNVVPGETALVFYTAHNPTDNPIIGVSSYNVVPYEAGQYFNKIQCFCFEEQQLNPHEEVDMPVFFYVDPAFDNDPYMENVNEIILSYTFFQAKEGMKIPIPSYVQKHLTSST